MAKNNPDPNEWVTNESRGPNIIRKKKIGGKGESSIYEWGLPPDKIPGNRPNIPWTKAAEEALGLEYDPNEAKALQKLLIQKLQVRLDEVKATFFKHKDLKGGKNKIAQLLKETDFDASQIFKHKNTESKAIRRALASMFSTDANFFAEKGVWNLLKTDLSRLEGEELFKVVKGLDAALSGEKGGLVGHHTTLSAVTNVMDKVDEKWRVEFNKLSKEDGYRIGERGLERIQPVTHKPFDTKKGFPNIRMVKGELAKKLAPLMPNAVFNKDTLEIVKGQHPKIDAFLDKMAEISTHGTGYGGTVGFSLDANLAQLTPQNAYNNARNIFAAEEVIQNQGKRLNVKLNKALRNFNFTNIDEAADFLLSKANQKDWQPAPIKSNLIAEARNELDPGNDPRANVDYEKSRIKLIDPAKDVSEDVLDRYSPPRTVDTPDNHLFRGKLKSILTPQNITKAGALKTITSIPKSLAKGLVGPEDIVGEEVLGNVGDFESKVKSGTPWKQAAVEEGKDIAGELKNQALIGGGVALAAKVTGTGAALGSVFNPVTVTPLLAYGAYRGIDAYLERSGKKGLTRRYANFLNMYETKDPETGLGTGKYEKDPDLEKEKWDKMRTYFENRNKSN